MIFANHAHTYPKEVRPGGTVDALKRHMEACGIDKCIAFSTFIRIIRENGLDYNPNRRLYEELKGCTDILGFGTVDATVDNVEEQVEEIASYGFRGVKVHPQAQRLPITAPRAMRIYEKCQELGLFVVFHSGIHWDRLRDNAVVLFDEVAYNFPNLRFSMEHVGGYSFFNEAVAVMVNNKRGGIQPRVFAGWTTIGGENGPWSLTDRQLYTLLAQTTDANSIFGLDFPFHSAEANRCDIARIRGLDLPEETKQKILGGNLMAALGLS